MTNFLIFVMIRDKNRLADTLIKCNAGQLTSFQIQPLVFNVVSFAKEGLEDQIYWVEACKAIKAYDGGMNPNQVFAFILPSRRVSSCVHKL